MSVISFVFKLLFSVLLGGSLAYSHSEIKRDSSVISTALLSMISAAVFGSIIAISGNFQNGLTFGSFLILSVVLFRTEISIFRGVSAIVAGLLTGLGLPAHAIFFTITVFILNRYLDD